MRKSVKIIAIILLLCVLNLLANQKVFANNIADLLQEKEYSEEFKKWQQLTDEEKTKVIMPRKYDIKNSETEYKKQIHFTRMLGSGLSSRYSLKDTISNNLSIRNQQNTTSCWAFAALSSLETNIALSNYKNNVNISKVYDFSERHMNYSTSQSFLNSVNNPMGYNRNVKDGGAWYAAESYLINGSGAIAENEMPFENNENLIDINEIQNKTVSSQVYDIVYFEDATYKTGEEKARVMDQIKQHIKNYGSVFSSIHGNSSNSSSFPCYNNDTGAKYCSNSFLHEADHAISIIGWDDNYSIDNFQEDEKPSSKGAWIIRNSWGEREEYTLTETKEEIYNSNQSICNANGWTEPSQIPNEVIESNGYTIEGNMVYKPIGDNGLMYISYEDCNIYAELYGIEKATDTVNYDHIYQYDEFYPMYTITYNTPKVMLGNIFEKNNSETEYLTEVSLHAPETYTCKVYVNPNGSGFSKANLIPVPLKTGETETINAGYHTLEFSKPIALTGTEFAVVIEITVSGYRTEIMLESEMENIISTTAESGKCFIADSHDFDKCSWADLGKLSKESPTLIDGDSTIKAFTTNQATDATYPELKLTSNKYEIEDGNKICRISPNTTVANFKTNINTGVVKNIVNNKGNTIMETETLGTGNIIKLTDNTTYTLIVIGDVNGDGKITATDITKIKRNLVGIEKLNGVYEKAGDINKSNTMTTTDLLKVKQYIIGISSI